MVEKKDDFDSLKSEFRRIEDFETVEILGDDGGFDALIGVSTRFFVTDGHTEPRRLQAIETMRRYYTAFNSHLTHYILRNGAARPLVETEAFEYFKSVAGIDDPDVEGLLLGLAGFTDGRPERIPLHFECRIGMEMPYWNQFNVYSEWAASTNFSALGEPYHQALVARVIEWATVLKPRHGTSGPSFLLDQTFGHQRSGQTVFPHLKRFPGLDYDDGGAWITAAGRDVKIRSINWLTVIDDAFVDELGGLDALKVELGTDREIHVYDGGIVIQAGPKPEIGDVNNGVTPEHYRVVARALKPIRFEAYVVRLLHPPAPLDPIGETLAWIRRFD